MPVFTRKRILILILVLCQIVALANGLLTIVVDVESKSVLSSIFQTNLPQLTFLYSLSWRNWKLMESLAQNFVLGGNGTTYQAQVNYHLAAIGYEAVQSKTDFGERIKNLVTLRDGCLAVGNMTAAFDENLLALDKLATAAVGTTGRKVIDELQSMQNNARGTLYTNYGILGVSTILRIAQVSFTPRSTLGPKQSLLHWISIFSMFALSALEAIAFIIITNTRLSYIDTLVKTQYPLYEAAWQIKYLDPILTGSAMRFTLSNGDSSWSDRYTAALDPLTAAYTTAATYNSSVVQALNELNFNANLVLVDLETVALTNATAGKDALTGLSYTSNKDIYLFSVESLLVLVQTLLNSGLAATSSICEALVYFAAILTAISLLLFVSEFSRLVAHEGNETSEADTEKGKVSTEKGKG